MSSRVKRKPQPVSKPKTTVAAVTPTKNFGIEVTPTDDGFVQLTIHAGNVAVTAAWAKQDAHYIANLLLKACDLQQHDPIEIVRESGLLVTDEMP